MPSPVLELRPAVIEDAALVADLETALAPDDARDPLMMAFWWTHHTSTETVHRLVAVREGAARMYASASHDAFRDGEPRFGRMRLLVHPDDWTEARFREVVMRAEEWLRAEGTRTSVANLAADRERDVRVLESLGFAEVRRARNWRLDLVQGRERLLRAAAETRAEQARHGVELLTLDADRDPDSLRKAYELDIETTPDIPTTVPEPLPTFDEWRRNWFENPAHTPGRFWLARQGDAVLGMSVIGYPPVRGVPWTSYTGVARAARGRGIARALKLATLEQAIDLGARQVETSNDSENAPILHLNEALGYRLHRTFVELHRAL